MKRGLLSLLIAVTFLAGCSQDSDLDKTPKKPIRPCRQLKAVMTKGRLFMAEKKSAARQAPPMIDGSICTGGLPLSGGIQLWWSCAS